MKKLIILMLLGLSAVACSNPATSKPDVANTSESAGIPVVAIGQMNSDYGVIIAMTLAVFGSTEADFENAGIDVYINGGLRYNGIDPADYYDADSERVLFILSPVSVDDQIEFDITKSGVIAVTYSGIVSDEEDTTAENMDLTDAGQTTE